MQRRIRAIIATLLVALLTVPIVGATWGGRGFYEPDTEYDLDGWMWLEPDTDPAATVQKVYFSAFGGQYLISSNGNSGVLKSHVAPYPTNIHAFLGVWKDCNNDGYIGSIETALLEYRSVLLTNKTICPEQKNLDPHASTYYPVHNDGEWVREFLWIGPDYVRAETDEDGCWWTPTTFDCTRRENATNPYNIADESARIWADWGLPEDAGTESCPVHPRPRGTYQSTGGFLRYSDCHARWRITGAANDVDNATTADEDNNFQIGFNDAAYNHPENSQSVLNQKNPYGNEKDGSYVSAWDCSATPETVDDPANGAVVHDDDRATVGSHGVRVRQTNGNNVFVNFTNDDGKVHPLWSHDANGGEGSDEVGQVNKPKVPTVSTTGSPAGTANETLEGAAGDCDRSYGAGERSDVYELDEEDFEGNPAKRLRTDMMFYFIEGKRAHRDSGVPKTVNENATGQATPWDTFTVSGDIGFPYTTGGTFLASPTLGNPDWYGSPAYAVSRNPYMNRDTFEPWGGVYVTSYAYVGKTGLSLPAGALTGVYGAQHCNGTTEVTGAWVCDPNEWYPIPDKKPEDPPTGRNQWNVVVGDPYNLVDIDCYDGGTGWQEGPGTGVLVAGGSCNRVDPDYPWES